MSDSYARRLTGWREQGWPVRLGLAALAGLLATVPMTALMQVLYHRLPRHEQDPLPPSQITEKITDEVGVGDNLNQREHIGLTLLAHFGYGAAAGALYGPLSPKLPGPLLVRGALFGLAVWTGSYLGLLPVLNILPPATQHPARRNALMIAAHLVWGGVLAILAGRAGLISDRRAGR